jgi:hypothetical protein
MKHLIRLTCVLSGLALPGVSHAAFQQATCSTAGYDTGVTADIGGNWWVKKSTSPAGGPTDMTMYNLRTQSTALTLATNPNVLFLRPAFGFFNTELNFDYVLLQSFNLSQSWKYTGTLNNSTTSLVSSNDDVYTGADVTGSSYVFWSWTSDSSIANFAPPSIAQFSPRCKSNQTATATNSLPLTGGRTDLLLIKNGDVIYGSITQPANRPMIITLDGISVSADADIDLYVSATTSTPDDSNYLQRGFSTSASEALLIPATASQRTLYIGVHSYSGTGHVALRASATNTVSANVCATDGTMNTRITLTAAELSNARQMLTLGSAHFLSYTNGMVFRNQYTLNTTWTGSCTTAAGCDVCLVKDGTFISFGNSGTNGTCGHVDMHDGNWNAGSAWLYAHESGHACFGLPDEYVQPPVGGLSTPRYCGHTVMANNSRANAFCSNAHCRDGQQSDPMKCSTSSNSNWTIMEGTAFANAYTGRRYGQFNITADIMPDWNNTNLVNLVTTSGF